jgi:hypothetical protein
MNVTRMPRWSWGRWHGMRWSSSRRWVRALIVDAAMITTTTTTTTTGALVRQL